ncbi:MAG: DDE-type integrase/transposase/recombinase, partial [Nanoarchaeota archaeon]|nr:DDE-type integrase/transposase/recombinase [Nanoarchaeota archaeon]
KVVLFRFSCFCMKKEEIRKEYFKLKIRGHSNNQCRKILLAQFGYEVTIRTLRRWTNHLNSNDWDLCDKSKRPKTIYYKLTKETEEKIIAIKNQTGWGEEKIAGFVDVGHTTINKILNKHNLTHPNPHRRKRIKYIRWQRKHPNSLWQMDTSDQKIEGKYCFAVIDDCSRYCPGLFALDNLSTKIITHLLDKLIAIHGKPREILTDNGAVFGLRSIHSQFDRWCRRRGIKHIRTAVHSPTTSGKIERFFQTLDRELKFCNGDSEYFRMRYNHFRPHTSLKGRSPAEVYFDFSNLF